MSTQTAASTKAPADAAAASRAALRIDAIASGFIGALALAVSTYNVYLQRQQIRAQVWPHVELTYSESYAEAEPSFEWNLANSGVGPARVENVRVKVDGAPVASWEDATKALAHDDAVLAGLFDANSQIDGTKESVQGRVISPGVTIHPLRISGPNLQAARDSLRKAFSRVSFEICYCSTLDECWMWPTAERVGACPAGGVRFRD